MPKPRKRKPKSKFKAGKRISCPITTGEGEHIEKVVAYLAAPGLAVHKMYAGYWTITHALSGLSAKPSKLILEKKVDAMRFARCLAEVINFTTENPGDGINFLNDIQPIIKRFKAGHNPTL